MMDPSSSPFLFFLFFAALWLAISGLLPYLSGWAGLANKYRTSDLHPGATFRYVSGSMGESKIFRVRYRHCLAVTITHAGFRISVIFLFRFLCPPLFIPWQDVETVTQQRVWLVQRTFINIREIKTRIMILGKAGTSLARYYEETRP